jgi:hypothetical protein
MNISTTQFDKWKAQLLREYNEVLKNIHKCEQKQVINFDYLKFLLGCEKSLKYQILNFEKDSNLLDMNQILYK